MTGLQRARENLAALQRYTPRNPTELRLWRTNIEQARNWIRHAETGRGR